MWLTLKTLRYFPESEAHHCSLRAEDGGVYHCGQHQNYCKETLYNMCSLRQFILTLLQQRSAFCFANVARTLQDNVSGNAFARNSASNGGLG